MKNVAEKLRNYSLYLGMLVMILSFASCSDDDDDDLIDDNPVGAIEVADDQMLSDMTLTVQSVSVDQDSWLVAVRSGEEETDNFITEPVMIEEGTVSDVELTITEAAALEGDEDGTEIVLKLYADNPDEGTQGEWDDSDEPIMDENDMLVTETITVFQEDMAFADFDTNNDNMLDATEVPNIYADNFAAWDMDDDGFLDEDEFYTTAFTNTDSDDDELIDEEEWNLGFDAMFGAYTDDDFATFDADASGGLDEQEWNSIFGDSDWFETFDADEDSLVAETEWDDGVFADWDVDGDDFIDEEEFDVFAPFVRAW